METKGNLRSASHAQSSTEGLLPATHRLDLLITEQRTLVKTSQDNLQQALTNFQRSNSKEEQESSRMQVQSLLTRAQELVVTVQVILHIRSEIGHIQREIWSVKEKNEPTSKLHGRLQWLEQHLEKILMARRRGRPGVHGKRTQVPAQAGRAGARAGGRRLQGKIEPTQRDTFSIRTPSRMGNFSDFDGVSMSQQDSPNWKSESTGTSNFRNAQTRSLASSKQSASRDSDDWHSESEANWTMVEAYSNQPKDITQSQVLSEDDPKQSQLAYTPSWSKSRETPASPNQPPQVHVSSFEGKNSLLSPKGRAPRERNLSPLLLPSLSGSEDRSTSRLQGTMYNFEPRRSVEVFGEGSWNSLCLAANSNLVRSGTGFSTDILGISMSMLHAGVSDICKDIESLKKLIINAGQAASGSGPLVSANRAAVHFILCSREKSASRRSGSFRVSRSSHEGKFSPAGVHSTPSPDEVRSECTKINPSRKVYGKKVIRDRSSTYPRTTGVWCKSSLPHTDKSQRHIVEDDISVPVSALVRLRSPLKRIKSRLARTQSSRGSRSTGGGDIFGREKHQEKCINQMMAQLESTVDSVRKDSVQALGILPFRREQTVEKLIGIMIDDKVPLVQYEAFKSLLTLGVVNDEVIGFASSCLRQGYLELTSDLLQFFCQDCVIDYLTQKLEGSTLSPIEILHEDLVSALRTDEQGVCFPTALLLSRAGLEREACIQLLKQTLDDPLPEKQSQALSCLVKCWKCSDKETIHSSLRQMRTLHSWKLRQKAVEGLTLLEKDMLLYSNKDMLLVVDETGQSIYNVLMDRLPNEPILAVRVSIRLLLTHLGLDSKAENVLMGKLESKSEVVRGEAITALSAFELKSQKNVRAILECLDLDPSTYVRVQVVRLFSNMKHITPAVLTQLIEKSKGKGPVAKECLVALQRISKSQQEE